MEILLFWNCLKGADNHGLLLQAKESHLFFTRRHDRTVWGLPLLFQSLCLWNYCTLNELQYV